MKNPSVRFDARFYRLSGHFGGRTKEAVVKHKTKGNVYEPGNDFNHSADTCVGRGIANLGIQRFLGLCPRRHRRPSIGHNHNHASALFNCFISLSSVSKFTDRPAIIAHLARTRQAVIFVPAILLAFFVLSCISALSGCQTAHGFGEDMENAGHKIQEGTQ